MSRRPSSRQIMTAALDELPLERRYLFLFTYFSGLIALQILYLALDDMQINLWLSGALTAGFIYSYFLESRFRSLTVYWVSALSTGVAIYYYLQIQDEPLMLGNYLGVLAGILVAMLAFKAFAPGDHRFILMFCVVFLLFSSVASYDLKYMLLLPVFLLFAASSLYISSQVDVSLRVGRSGGVPPPSIEGMGRSFYTMLLRAVGGIILLSVAAYLITPHGARENRNLILSNAPEMAPQNDEALSTNQTKSHPGGNGAGENEIGIGNDFDLSDSRKLSSNPRPVLHVKSHRNGYLRAQVYDYYTGTGWIKSPEMEDLIVPRSDTEGVKTLEALSDKAGDSTAYLFPLQDFPSAVTMELLRRKNVVFPENPVLSIDKLIDLKYEIIRQQISLVEDQPPFYFAMFQPYSIQNVSLDNTGKRLDLPMVDIGGTVRPANLSRNHPARFTYTIQSLAPRYTERDLRNVAFTGPEQIVEHYTQLPAPISERDATVLGIEPDVVRPLSKTMRNFALGVIATAEAEQKEKLKTYDKVQAIYDYLTGDDFTYTRDETEFNENQEITEAFCLGSQQGHCRYFASSMAVLCRVNGIPARVVSGFAPGSYSLIDNAYVYRASNAHAWCEVYFDGYGWITFDPSPASSDVFNEGQATEALRSTVNFLQELFVLDPAGTQRTVLAALAAAWLAILARGPATLLLLTVLAGLIWGWFRIRRIPRRIRIAPDKPENAVIEVYMACIAELGRIGRRLQPGDTGRTYLQNAGQGLHPVEEPLRQLIPLYERAAFSPAGVKPEEAQFAAGVLESVRTFVDEELKRRRRARRR